MTTSGDASTIKFGSGLDVTDEGAGTIRVDTTVSGGLELIADVTIDALDSGGVPTGAPSGFDVTGIPGTYSDLLGVVSVRVPSGSPTTVAYWQLNNTASLIYYQREPTDTDWGNPHYPFGGDSHFITHAPGASADTDQFSEHSFLVPGYATTDRKKTIQIDGIVLSRESDGRLIFFHEQISGLWDSTAAINRLSIGPSGLADGSRLRLYGRT